MKLPKPDILYRGLLLTALLAYGVFCILPHVQFAYFPEWTKYEFFLAGFIVLCCSSFFYLFWGLSACLYKPFRCLKREELPGVTVIVPAYNEGYHVVRTLESLMSADYPLKKLEVITVNDGSQDNTLCCLRHCAMMYPGRIEVVNLPVNMGKKHALARGIRKAKHDYIITVDSDTVIEPETLRNLLSPFFHDKRVGAVAGNIVAGNRKEGFIPKLLDVTLVFGCEFLRTAQSLTGCVVCTPGALSAYRKEILLSHLDEWLDQKFMGCAANIGEDRAIATLILGAGHRIVHQRTARCITRMPVTYNGMCRMLIRWNRSDIRENFLMLRPLFRNKGFLSGRNWLLFFHWIPLMLNIMLPIFFVPLFLFFLTATNHLLLFLACNIMATCFFTLIPAVIYGKSRPGANSSWPYIYGFYYPVALFWIYPWSFFTMRNSRWLTREITQKNHHPFTRRFQAACYLNVTRPLRAVS